MRIGEVASRASVSVETLRYYERRGLLPVPKRSASGYRSYEVGSVRRVRFIKHAQELGFTLEEILDLLGMWQDSTTSCEQVANRAEATLARIDDRIRQLRRIRGALDQYVRACRARESLSECPLLLTLGGTESSHDG